MGGGRNYVLRALGVRLLIKRAPGAVHPCTTPQAVLCAEKNGVAVVVGGVFLFMHGVAFDAPMASSCPLQWHACG